MTQAVYRKIAIWTTSLALLATTSGALALPPSNMPTGVTPNSSVVYDLHMLVFWVCVVIGIGVFSVMFYSIWKHRKSKGHKAAQFHESTTVEIVWTLIPFAILVAVAIPATKALIQLEDTAGSDMTIKVTGYQWKWEYEYLDEGIQFFSNLATPREQIYNVSDKGENYLLEVDNEVVVPVNKKIRFLLTANDVIHSWWVPQLAVKQDAIPGFVNEAWTRIEKPGIYRGQCTELCGRDHGYMPVVVRAVPQDEYDQWVKEQQSGTQAAAVATESVTASR